MMLVRQLTTAGFWPISKHECIVHRLSKCLSGDNGKTSRNKNQTFAINCKNHCDLKL